MNNKVPNNRAWLLVLPMLVLVAFSAIIPLMTVVNYSVQDVLGPNARFLPAPSGFKACSTTKRCRQRFCAKFRFR